MRETPAAWPEREDQIAFVQPLSSDVLSIMAKPSPRTRWATVLTVMKTKVFFIPIVGAFDTQGNLAYFRQKRDGYDDFIEGWAERVEYVERDACFPAPVQQ